MHSRCQPFQVACEVSERVGIWFEAENPQIGVLLTQPEGEGSDVCAYVDDLGLILELPVVRVSREREDV
jgi:hypothetical protein